MLRPPRDHPGYRAFLAHRISGVLLALFLPAHFWLLGTAIHGEAVLGSALALAAHPLVKVAEWGLVVLLTTHLAFGLRVLVLELLPWRDARRHWVGIGAGAALLVGGLFLVSLAT